MASFATADPLPPSASLPLGEDVISAGLSVGVDVAALRNKYLIQKMTDNLANGSDDQKKVASLLEGAQRMRDLEARGGPNPTPLTDLTSLTSSSTTSSSSSSSSSEISAAQDRLDRLVVCPRCHGQGLHKTHYNFQVRDVNCDVCDGEGLQYKGLDGKLLKMKDAPKVERRYEMTEETERRAREMAESCGRRTGKEGEEEEAMRRDFAKDNGEAPPPVL